MSFYLVKTPNIIQRIFKNCIWSFPFSKNVQKTVYLTFDDGPTPEVTEWTLNVLKKHNAKATFFCIGKNIENHSEIYQRIINEGHSIGNHTHNHLNGWKNNASTYLENIELAEKTFKKFNKSNLTTINSEQLFRPPYGKIKPQQASKLRGKGYKIVMWDVLSADFDQKISVEKCYKNVVNNCNNGSIIVFHDSVKAEKNLKYVLPKVLEYLSDKGYVFKRIAQLN
jgi:peptidoglycan/xylan/chitin deacetylase (PgdA/CDA1 family)